MRIEEKVRGMVKMGKKERKASPSTENSSMKAGKK